MRERGVRILAILATRLMRNMLGMNPSRFISYFGEVIVALTTAHLDTASLDKNVVKLHRNSCWWSPTSHAAIMART